MKNLSIILIGLLAASVVGAVWLPPTETPPDGNLTTPINITSTDQTKSGALGLGALSCTNDAIFYDSGEEVKLGINVEVPVYTLDVAGTLQATTIISGTYPVSNNDIATKQYVDDSFSSPSVTIVESVGDNNLFPVYADCPSGSYVVGGGHSRTLPDYSEITSFPDTNRWTAICAGMSGPGSCKVYAICYSQ